MQRILQGKYIPHYTMLEFVSLQNFFGLRMVKAFHWFYFPCTALLSNFHQNILQCWI